MEQAKIVTKMSKDWIFDEVNGVETKLEEDYPEETVLEFKADIPEIGLKQESLDLVLPGFDAFKDNEGKVMMLCFRDFDKKVLKIYEVKEHPGAKVRADNLRKGALLKGWTIYEMESDVKSMIDTAILNLRLSKKKRF